MFSETQDFDSAQIQSILTTKSLPAESPAPTALTSEKSTMLEHIIFEINFNCLITIF